MDSIAFGVHHGVALQVSQKTSFCSHDVVPCIQPRRRERARMCEDVKRDQGDDREERETQAEHEDETQQLFVDEENRKFWEEDLLKSLNDPLTEADKALLRKRLPKRVAEFIIRRADATLRRPLESTLLGKLIADSPPDVRKEPQYSEYVYDTAGGRPTFTGPESVLEEDPVEKNAVEGVTEVDSAFGKEWRQTLRKSLFAGEVGGRDEQATQVGYGILALLVGFAVLKIAFGLIQFFVSFTFSFFAIFALSAGLFVVFVLFRF